MRRAISAPDIKLRNLRSIFDLARQRGEVLRPEITRYTGLTPPTVMKAVQQLVGLRILVEAGEMETALGRKPVRLVFNSSAAVAVGIVFEGDDMHAGVVDLAGNTIRSICRPMNHTFDKNTVVSITECIRSLTDTLGMPVLGVGLGVPGVVNAALERIDFAPLIGITEPFDCKGICGDIHDETGLTVFLENDVNATASGEFFYRKLTHEDDLLYVSMGTGIGAGIILKGVLRKGARNLAGELGYAVQNTSFQVDRRRPGWLESQIGLDSLKRQFNWAGYGETGAVPDGLIVFLADHLAPVVANLATQLDIRLIALGGLAMETFGEPLFQALKGRIRNLSLMDGDVQRSLCDEPGIVGAAVLAIDQQMDSWLK